MQCIARKICVKTWLGPPSDIKTVMGAVRTWNFEGIRRHLWLRPSQRKADVFHKLEAPYVLKAHERTTVVDIIRKLKTPSNYVGAIHKYLEEGKLCYMKSHDFHVLMKEVCIVLISSFTVHPDIEKTGETELVVRVEVLLHCTHIYIFIIGDFPYVVFLMLFIKSV
jgi:hypothetical protein